MALDNMFFLQISHLKEKDIFLQRCITIAKSFVEVIRNHIYFVQLQIIFSVEISKLMVGESKYLFP